jgi:serine/threonine-protein kinase
MIGQKLGSFKIEAKIGSGAMGAVYRGVHEPSGRAVAIKVITGEQGQKATAPTRFVRESEILEQFRHPNIVRYYGRGRFQGTLYLAMEFVPGQTLEDLLEQRGCLSWRETVDLGIQICEALEYAHQRNVVHRDLKPSNLMVTQDGKIKLTDFGIAKSLDATALTATGRTLGTAAYMAPEQIRGTPEVSHKTDLYALGCVLYQMLTGQIPFSGKTTVVLMHSHLNDTPPRPSSKNPDIPKALENLVVGPPEGSSEREAGPCLQDAKGPLYLMAKDRDRRPRDAAAVAQLLIELRDKAERGEPVPMVFGNTAHPTRLGAAPPGPTVEAPTTKTRKASKSGRRARVGASAESSGTRPRIAAETIGLVVAFAGLSAFGAYMLWPPSAAYLHRKAAEGMASPNRVDWLNTLDDYIKPLDERFPDHPYKAETQAWRDHIDLDFVRRRASILEKPNLAGLSEPKGEAQILFVKVMTEVAEDLKAGQDPLAVAKWREMADVLRKSPEDRGWSLLATEKADELETTMAERRKAATAFLDQADLRERTGQFPLAIQLRRGVVDRYGKYVYLADLIERARAGLPQPEPEPKPDEAAETKAEPPKSEPKSKPDEGRDP